MMRHPPTGPVLLTLLLAFGVSSASVAESTPAPAVEAAAVESRKLSDLVEAYFEEQLKLNPLLATSIGDPRYNDRFEVTISPEWRARDEKVERDYLERLKAIDPALLSGQDALTYEIFKSAREREIERVPLPGPPRPGEPVLLGAQQFRSARFGQRPPPVQDGQGLRGLPEAHRRLRCLDRPGHRQHA